MPPGTPGRLRYGVPFFILPPGSKIFGGNVRLNRLGQGTSLVWGRLVAASMVLAALAGGALWMGSRVGQAAAPAAQLASTNLNPWAAGATPEKVLKTFGQLPLMFEPNVGQTDGRVKFMARGTGYGLFLTGNEAVLSFAAQPAKDGSAVETSVLRMRLSGAAVAPRVSGEKPLPGKSNYFLGSEPSKWHRDVAQYARVKYKGVYPGVDLEYYGNQGQLEYDFTVAPGADPKAVRLSFAGGEKVALESGDLILSMCNASMRLHAPRVYQLREGQEQSVDSKFVLLAENEVGFEVGAYDRAQPLVIDPVLSYSTYLGGTGAETAPRIAVDSAFNFYVAGSTTSTDFPIPSGVTPFQANKNGAANVFVAKFNSSGSALEYASYLGGNGTDTAAGLAVDAAGNIYIAGTTTSTNFPTSSATSSPPGQAPFQATPKTGSGTHTFVTKLNPSPTSSLPALPYSTYLSGSGTDTMSGLTIDSKGFVYVIGITNSSDFPIAPSQGALQNMRVGPIAFFVSKIDPTQASTASLIYSTYFGGSFPTTGTVTGGGIAIDNNSTGSNIFITGGTNFQFNGNQNDFPIKNAGQGCLDTPGQSNENGNCSESVTQLDAFVAKINPLNTSGAQLIYSTYIGGAGNDVGNGIAVDAAGNAYIAGYTDSTDDPLLITAGAGAPAYQTTNKGTTDAFVAKVTNPVAGSNNSNVVFSYFSYLGGSGIDKANSLAIDTVQGAIVAGTTNSADFNVTPDALQATLGGANDAFVARLDTTGFSTASKGTFATYLGGAADDHGTGVAVDSNAVIYVAGDTASNPFPTTASAFQKTLKGSQNAFAAKLGPAVNLTVMATQSGTVNAGNQATFNYVITNNGDAVAGVAFIDNLATTGVVANFVSATAAGGSCPPSPTNNTIICNVGVLNGGASTTVSVVVTPTSAGTLGNSGTVIVAGSTFTASASASLGVASYSLAVQPSSQTVTAGNPATFGSVTLSTLGSSGTYTASISLACPSGLPNGVSCTFSTTPVTLQGQSPSSVTLTMSTTARTTTIAATRPPGVAYAMWLPIGGLTLFGMGLGGTLGRKRRVVGGLLILLVMTLIALQPACSHSSSTTINAGTPAGTYAITVSATSGTFSQTQLVQLVVQ